MPHEIPAEPGPTKIRFIEREGDIVRKAALRTSLLQPNTLAWVQSQKVQYLDEGDARALRDYLTTWLRQQRRRNPQGGSS